MPRNFTSTEPLQKPDPKFDSLLATKLINKIMVEGKKSIAQGIFYEAMDLSLKRLTSGNVEIPIEGETDIEKQITIFTRAVENAKPQVEVRSKRVGGANYQVPREVKRQRQRSLAIRWLVDNARKKKGKPMAKKLADEICDAYNGTGATVTWKENVHKMAEANKAYAHYAR